MDSAVGRVFQVTSPHEFVSSELTMQFHNLKPSARPVWPGGGVQRGSCPGR
jgi:hypothetical protein